VLQARGALDERPRPLELLVGEADV
jgi:hypothetical protein